MLHVLVGPFMEQRRNVDSKWIREPSTYCRDRNISSPKSTEIHIPITMYIQGNIKSM